MIELLNMDCMEYLAGCADKSFDLAIVDPPYGIGVNHSMGRRAGQPASGHAPAVWDFQPPPAAYFVELFRVSVNQVIWGANHFIDRMPMPSACWLMWDKLFSPEVTFAQFELAWTSLSGTCKKFNKAPNERGRIHPTQKPQALYRWILQNYAQPNQRILDTHLGSGSSAIAAHYFGCDFVGTELDPDYFAAAKARFDNETRQGALL